MAATTSADSNNPAVRVVTLLVNSNMEEIAMYAVAVLPLLCLLWSMMQCICCCGEGGKDSDIELAVGVGAPKGDGALQQLAADSSQPPWLRKMLQKTAQHVDEGFVRLRQEAAADHRLSTVTYRAVTAP